MKKLIAGFMTALMALLVVASPVLAMEPCPIALDIVTLPVSAAEGLQVVLKLDGEPLEQNYVNGYYEVMFEVSDKISGSCSDKVFEAVIVQCEAEARCRRNVMFSPYGWQTWDITGIPLPTTTTTSPPATTTTTTTTIAPTPTTTIPCEDCEVCEDCPTDEVDYLTWIQALAISGASVLITAKGLFHYHKGIRSRHSIFTEHRSARIRHPKGKIYPKYVKKSDGKYYYEG